MKKSLNSFLDEVIIPLENIRIKGDGKLFVSLEERILAINFNEPLKVELDLEQEREWHLISGRPTGEWNIRNRKMGFFTIKYRYTH